MQMKRLLPVLVILSLILIGCTPAPPPPPPEPDKPAIVSQDFFAVYSGEFRNLNYLVTSTLNDMIVAQNCVMALVQPDNYGVLQPHAAESWTISPDGTVYTFKLREGQMWRTWEGEEYAETVAQDFVDAVKAVLDPETASFSAHHMRGTIKNADEYFLGLASDDHTEISFDQVGIKALDEYTVEYTLAQAMPWFPTLITHSVYMPVNAEFLADVGEDFGTDHQNMLYNGPYIWSGYEASNFRTFIRNEGYWDKDNVHIGSLNYTFNREAATLSPELFYRGETSSAGIASTVIDGWLEDPERVELVVPALVNWQWNFWYGFNFDPQFAAEYEPENWRLAVQSLNFRKAIFHGIDRVAAHLTIDPYNPERQLKNTITPPTFLSVNGVDYTQLPALKDIANTDPFQPELAKEYAAKAMEELDGIVTFPVKIKWNFSTAGVTNSQRSEVVKQQMETLFGDEFIELIAVGYPATGYLDATRRNGNYALQEVNWGAGYVDPFTYTPPYHTGNPMRYTDISIIAGDEYQMLLDKANAERVDLERRYNLFAESEAYLIENALVAPYRGGGGGYQATRIQPFSQIYNAVGFANLGFKYAWIREEPVTSDEYNELLAQWEVDRAAALRAAGQ